jgi:hypothetical protein
MKKQISILLLIFCLSFLIIAGCTSDQPSVVTQTPTPQIVYVTVTVTPSVQPSITSHVETIELIPTSVLTPALSTSSEDVNNPDDDAFLTVVAENNIVKRIDTLATYGCDITEAGKINQILIANKKPNNSTLMSARTNLISASTYCQAPEKASRDQSQTSADLKKFSILIKEYANSVPKRSYELDRVLASVDTIGTFKTALIMGNGENSIPFALSETGLKIIDMNYAGEHNFIVKIDGNIVTNQIGSYSGVESQKLFSGKHVLTVTASGPWTIQIS